MKEFQINKTDDSVCTDSDTVGYQVYDDNINTSEAIQKYKQRLLLKQSLLSSFGSKSQFDDYEDQNNKNKDNIHIKNMPAFQYVYENQYSIFTNDNDKQNLERTYNEIFLLSDFKFPDKFFDDDSQSCFSSNMKINLISKQSVQKNIFKKIYQCNKHPNQQVKNNKTSHQVVTNKLSKEKILKSQFSIAIKFLLQQYKSTSTYILFNLILGISIILTSFFVCTYQQMIDDNKSLSLFDSIIHIYYLLSLTFSLILLYKSTIHSYYLAVKLNKYLSCLFLLISIIDFALIFEFDTKDDLQILSIFGIAQILLYLFHTFQSIKLFNLFLRLEVLLGVKSKEYLKI